MLAINPNQPIIIGIAPLVTNRMQYAKAPMVSRVIDKVNLEFFIVFVAHLQFYMFGVYGDHLLIDGVPYHKLC